MNKVLLLSQQGDIAVDENNQPRWFTSAEIDNLALERLSPAICIDLSMSQGQSFMQAVSHFEGVKVARFRDVLLNGSEEQASRLTRSKQLMHWYLDNQFCGRCSAKMDMQSPCVEPVKHCVSCDFTVYPRISPCIICLIYKEDKILLARPAGRTSGFYSLIAGFIEAGETAEQAVHREIYEEVGLKVTNLKYALSQSWPFSHSLMLGFIAEYQSGDLEFIDGEIGEADWYAFDELPAIPPAGTVAYKIIEQYKSMQNFD